MAKLYGEIAKNALLTLDKSFSRALGQPLDASEVYYSKAAADAYAATPAAYIGQKIVVIEDGKVTHYSVEDAAGTLKEVGVKPIGDGKSIAVTEAGVVSILGADSADSLTLPRMKEDKSGIEWVPVSAVVEGDGNDNTTYEITALTKGEGEAAEVYGIKVKTFFNGTPVEDGEYTVEFDVYTKSEVDAAIKVVADKVGIAAEGQTGTLYELIAAEVTRATDAESALSDRIGVKKEGDTAASGVYAYIDGVIDAIVNGVDADKIDSLNELIAWVEAHPDIVSGLDERLDKVEGILEGIGDTEADEKATVKQYVDDKFTEHETAADGKYATKQEITDAGYAVADDVARDYATKEELTQHAEDAEEAYAKKATTLEGYGITDAYTKTETYAKTETYNKTEIDKFLDDVTGGSSESAASVKRALDGYIQNMDTEVYGADVVAKWTSTDEEGNPVYAPQYASDDSRIDKLAQRAADLEAKVGHDVDGENPATGLFLEVDEARAQADKGVADAAAAAQAVTQLTEGQVATNKTNVENLQKLVGAIGDGQTDTLAGKIGALEAHDQAHAVEFNTLSGKVDQNTADIAKKADADKVYTKGEVDAALLPLALAANVYDKTTADNTFLKKANYTPYDDTAVKQLITDEASRADTEEKRLAGLIGDNTAAINLLNDTADKEGSVKHTVATELAKIISDDDADIDTLNEIAAWIINDTTGAAKMANDIAALNIKVDTGDKKVSEYVADAITEAAYTLPAATAEILGGVKSAADVDGAVAINKVYFDAETNIGEVKAFSTDNLVQGKMTLVLNGGDAEVTSEG